MGRKNQLWLYYQEQLALFEGIGDSEKMNPQFYYGTAIILITVIANGIIKMKHQRNKRE